MFNIHKEIKTALKNDSLVLFIGSGFSVPFKLPNWRKLAFKTIESYNDINPKINLLKQCLEENLIDEILVFDALKSIDEQRVKNIVKEEIHLDFNRDELVNHKKLWEISQKIVTTNYDKLLEEAKLKMNIEIVSHASFNEMVTSFKNKKEWLFYLHGKIDRIDECVLFSEDYVKLYSPDNRAIQRLNSLVLNHTVVFIGFSMSDKYVQRFFSNLEIIFGSAISNDHFIVLSEDEDVPSKSLKKISLETYNDMPLLLDELIEIKTMSNQYEKPVKRYLRRRCRAFHLGTIQFNDLVKEILRHPIKDQRNFIKQIENFNDHYEKTILRALMYENMGEIEKMIEVLKNEEFIDKKELTRKLYLALGYEKIDYVNDAKSILHEIISYPMENEITLSAKFNLSVCHEKLNEYDKAHFKTFIESDIHLKSTDERLAEKAINNQLIICHKNEEQFDFKLELDNILNNTADQSPKSFYKTLVNHYTYENKKIGVEEFDEIFELSKKMTTNSRATLICQLYKTSNNSTQDKVRPLVLNELDSIQRFTNSTSVQKHINDLKFDING